jgi:hypothetical protein
MFYEFKAEPDPFRAVLDGSKPFEFRAGCERPVRAGDTVCLREWLPEAEAYTSRAVLVRVTYVLTEGYQLPDGAMVFGWDPRARIPCYGGDGATAAVRPKEVGC